MYLQMLKSLNRLHPRAWDFIQLSRMDRPIGIYLLLWPTLTAVWIAGHGSPTVGLSFGAVALAFCYPFMKRYTHFPQVVLGAAYSWGIPMAFMAANETLPASAWWLYLANLLWTVGYDTYYAMVDRDDDLKIGVKSTAILFGAADRQIILGLQLASLVCLLLAGLAFGLGSGFHLGLLGAALCFAWEYRSTRARDRTSCFKAFLHNHWAGLLVFLGVVLDYAMR